MAIEQQTPDELARALNRAYEARRWEELRRLIAADATLSLVVAGGESLGRDEVIDALRGRGSAFYEAILGRIERLDDRSAIASGRARRELPGQGFADDPVWWLLEFEGELLQRARTFASRDDAVAATRG